MLVIILSETAVVDLGRKATKQTNKETAVIPFDLGHLWSCFKGVFMITIFLRFLDLNIEHRFRAYIFLGRYELFSQGPGLSIF